MGVLAIHSTEAVEWTSLGGIVSSNVAAVLDAKGVIIDAPLHLHSGSEWIGQMWSMTPKLEEGTAT